MTEEGIELEIERRPIRPGARYIATFPDEAGKCLSARLVNDKVVFTMEGGVWIYDQVKKELSKCTQKK